MIPIQRESIYFVTNPHTGRCHFAHHRAALVFFRHIGGGTLSVFFFDDSYWLLSVELRALPLIRCPAATYYSTELSHLGIIFVGAAYQMTDGRTFTFIPLGAAHGRLPFQDVEIKGTLFNCRPLFGNPV